MRMLDELKSQKSKVKTVREEVERRVRAAIRKPGDQEAGNQDIRISVSDVVFGYPAKKKAGLRRLTRDEGAEWVRPCV